MSGIFTPAQRKRVHMKMAITGPSGAGKTYSALQLARGMGGKIALIDTENESASLYDHLGAFDVLPIHAPYTVLKYKEGIDAAVAAGYDVLIIDSITHAWAGEGGLLAQKEALDSRGGNSFANWAQITKAHEAFKASLLHAPIHLICTMRSKEDYAQMTEGNKTVVKKIGLAPVQREGMSYEFTIVFDVAQDHTATASKDRTGLFDSFLEKITPETGATIKRWLESGADPRESLIREINEIAAAKGYDAETAAQKAYQSSLAGCSTDQLQRMISSLNSKDAKKETANAS